MKVNISELKNKEKKQILLSESIEPSDIEQEIAGICIEDIHLEAAFYMQGDMVVMTGVVTGSYQTQCGRCLRPIEDRFERKLDERFVYSQDECPKEDCYVYQGESIDISIPLIDNIMLYFPLVVLCKQECKGLCSICGCDLNKQECSCEKQDINIQLEKLKEFFKE